MEVITYSLKKEKSNSEEYYKDIREFTKDVLIKAADSISPVAEEYLAYLKTFQLEEVREKEEYILELISFGILWKRYAEQALAVKTAPFITLMKMAEWRKKHQKVKPFIDFVRGIFLTLFLLTKKRNSLKEKTLPELNEIDHVCKWFEATGEFKEEALRFIRWRAFWGTKNHIELIKIFSAIENFTQWFEAESKFRLGKYTENVDDFLNKSSGNYFLREDRISCTRSRSEYHLNMVGAELMNSAFRKDFKKTKGKVVLVPGCMRIKSNEECKAVKVKQGLICEGCSPECKVNQLRLLGKKNGENEPFDVYIIPHASDLSLWSSPDNQLGVIASACVTTLVEGGWELKRYNVPAQCVLLDYCGCKKHWHDTGFATSLNIRELKRILAGSNSIN